MLRGPAVRGWPWRADRRAWGRKVPAHPKLDLATAERELSVPEGRWARSVPAVAGALVCCREMAHGPAALTLTLGEPAHSSCQGSDRPGDEGVSVKEISIGEFARRSRLSLKALRLYDERGVLVPARVDQASGYRYYDTAQLDDARLVVMLYAAVAVAARGGQGAARVRSGRCSGAHR